MGGTTPFFFGDGSQPGVGRRGTPQAQATSKRAPKPAGPKGYVDGSTARSHVSSDRVLKAAVKRR